MDLDEYLWRSRRSGREFAQSSETTPATVTAYRHRKNTPNLLAALKISEESEGKIQLTDLLSHEDLKKYVEWKEERKNRENSSNKCFLEI